MRYVSVVLAIAVLAVTAGVFAISGRSMLIADTSPAVLVPTPLSPSPQAAPAPL